MIKRGTILYVGNDKSNDVFKYVRAQRPSFVHASYAGTAIGSIKKGNFEKLIIGNTNLTWKRKGQIFSPENSIEVLKVSSEKGLPSLVCLDSEPADIQERIKRLATYTMRREDVRTRAIINFLEKGKI